MLEKELSELSDISLLGLYKAIIPSTSVLEHFGIKLDGQGGGPLNEIKNKSTGKNEISFDGDKAILNYKRHLIEMKILSLKILEEINQRGLETSEAHDLIDKEIEYIQGCTEFIDSSSGPSLSSVPQGAETLPYLNRSLKK